MDPGQRLEHAVADPLRPTVLSAIWRFRRLVLATVILAVALAVTALQLRPATWTASASLVLEDPRLSLPDGRPADADRYVADQREILASPAVAERAAEVLGESGPAPAVDDLLGATEILETPGSNLVTVEYTATSPEQAQAGANAIVSAYGEVLRSGNEQRVADAITRLDGAIAEAEQEFAETRQAVAAAGPPTGASEQAAALAAQLESLNERLVAATGDPAQTATLQAEIAGVTEQLQAVSSPQGDPGVVALLGQQSATAQRRADLVEQRERLRLNQALTSTGISSSSPARLPEQPSGLDLPTVVLLGALLGALGGTGLAYLLALRWHVVTAEREPEQVLGSPALVSIPAIGGRSGATLLPVRDQPQSPAATAYRFASSAIHHGLAAAKANLLMTVSPTEAAGATTVAANLALAAAQDGQTVLVIDADGREQALTTLLGGRTGSPGLAEVIELGLALEDALQEIPVDDGETLHLLRPGRSAGQVTDFFAKPSTQYYLTAAREAFDLVILDAPSEAHLVNAGAVVRHAGALVVVVPHRSAVGDLERLAQRLRLLGADVLGYVYHRAPEPRRSGSRRRKGGAEGAGGRTGGSAPVVVSEKGTAAPGDLATTMELKAAGNGRKDSGGRIVRVR